MFSLAFRTGLAALWLLHAGAVAAASLTALETDPPSPASLNRGEPFHVRFAVEDPEPTRIQIKARFQGAAVTDLYTGPVRHLPAGGGTEAAYVSLQPRDEPAAIDEILLTVSRDGPALSPMASETFSVPVQVTWSTTPAATPRPEPRWTGEHRAAETVRLAPETRAAPARTGWLGRLGIMALSLLFIILAIAAVWLPLRAWRRWEGGWRVAAVACTVPTLYVLSGIAVSLLENSMNPARWPYELAIALPISLAAFTLVALARHLRH